jgi:signal transduction histidine kinase/CheY-like chemotaxis protein
MSLRTRLLMLVALATLVPAILVGLRFFQNRSSEVAAALVTLSATANNISNDLDEKIQGTAQLHYGLARAHDLDTRDKAACSAFLSAVREAYPQYTGILTIDPDGQLFCDSLRTGRTLDLNDRDYFRKALISDGVVTLEPVFGRLTGLSVLQIAYPARSETGQLKFVLLASFNLQKFAEFHHERLSRLMEILIIDKKGTVLVRPPGKGWVAPAGASIASTELFRLATARTGERLGEVKGLGEAKDLGEAKGLVEVKNLGEVRDSDGRVQVWAVADSPAIRDPGLHILVGQPKDELVAAANRRLGEDIAVLAVLSLLLFAGVWTLGELGIRRQVGRLTAMATKLGLGDLSARVPPPFPGGELGGLMRVVNDTAESLERQRAAIDDLNQKLRQSQKMEELGQLTGGIAHDFNNTLTVITGTIDILAEAVSDKPQLATITRLISEAADRGAEMTRHLLAFARRQPLQPRETDISLLMLESAKLLRSTLGEHIEIETILKPDVWPALVDPSQLSSALLNLAINARDAMPRGGKLILEASNVVLDESNADAGGEVRPGSYVLIAVSDTGVGIPAAIRDKVFEPFFSTKDVGKGTGLGLSMVYGFVKQSGGHIKLYSEEGYGTTFRIYLPRADSLQSEKHGETAPSVPIEGSNETILVVEDDALVRTYVTTHLESLGYKTIPAANASEALKIVDRGAKFDLLFTDVIMPGAMNGRQLADAVAKRRGPLRVLFTSGYTEDAVVHHGRLDPGVLLLAKPYRKTELARMVRLALDTALAPSSPPLVLGSGQKPKSSG